MKIQLKAISLTIDADIQIAEMELETDGDPAVAAAAVEKSPKTALLYLFIRTSDQDPWVLHYEKFIRQDY